MAHVDGDLNSAVDAALDRLDPAAGVVLQFVWSGNRLVFIAHHLVVDGVSWRIIGPDLIAAWLQVKSVAPGSPGQVSLPDVGYLVALGGSTGSTKQRIPTDSSQNFRIGARSWPTRDPQLGDRPFDPAVDTISTVKTVRVKADRDVTDALLTKVTGLFHGGVNDGILAGLAVAVAKWREQRHVFESATLVRMEGHGREETVLPGADISRVQSVGLLRCSRFS